MKSIEETAKDFADRTQEAAAKLHKIFEPHWNVRADVLKTIVSLSSAFIVLSVTFSSSLRTLKLNPFWKYRGGDVRTRNSLQIKQKPVASVKILTTGY